VKEPVFDKRSVKKLNKQYPLNGTGTKIPDAAILLYSGSPDMVQITSGRVNPPLSDSIFFFTILPLRLVGAFVPLAHNLYCPTSPGPASCAS
jgi:hypothetical protein